MEVSNIHLEQLSRKFKNDFHSIFISEFHEITHTVINLKNNYISTFPSDYKWHLQYWGEDLDLALAERVHSGLHDWRTYSNRHAHALKKNKSFFKKIDLCTPCKYGFELFSVSLDRDIGFLDYVNLFKIKSMVASYANTARKKFGERIALPLRSQIIKKYEPAFSYEKNNNLFNKCNKYLFDGITLTRMELETIYAILELKSVKEISYFHQCSHTAERRRIENIKSKFGCAGMPLSALFYTLKKAGVTAACLDAYITSH